MAHFSESIQVQLSLFAECLDVYKSKGLKVFASSSFQTHSIPMLHIISKLDADIPIVFLQTGFHFPETMVFRDKISELLGLNLINIESSVSKLEQRDTNGQFLYSSDSSHCCYLNKTMPMESFLPRYDVWMSGVRRDQNENRKNFQLEAPGLFNTLRFSPMLDWSSKMIYEYRKHYDLPSHPLEAQGYLSIGCLPCTQQFLEGDERSGRWAGMKKTECGLHTDLGMVKNKLNR